VKRTEPLNVIWWLVSRASGIVALVLISATVLLGLAMAARAVRRPAIKRVSARLHWVLSAAHALGAGSDASKLWLRAVVLAPSVPVVYLLVLRLAPRRSSGTRRRDPVPLRADARAEINV
jgi:hypothetical protein